jgi:hypothetical protein
MMGRIVAGIAAAVLCAGCGPAPEGQGTAPVERNVERGVVRGSSSERAIFGDQVNRGRTRDAERAQFLNRIRSADPNFQTIERALINERNELGVILNRNVDLHTIPALMRSLLTQMAREFPGEDLTIIAYAPSEPPLKIGTARLDAQTKEMTYTATR